MDVSELVERLKDECRYIENCGVSIYQLEGQGSLGRFVHSQIGTIISALQTVAGIERLAAEGIGVFIDTTSIPDTVIVSWSETREASVGDDLHSAVSAAVEATKGGA